MDNNFMSESMATEILSMLKSELKKSHRLNVIVIVAFVLQTIIFMFCWSLPTEETATTSTEYAVDVNQDSGENGINNYVGDEGDINNGETENQKDIQDNENSN